ncbi:MAG: SUMF1/EgtB/PvdO family nonheme iron enzyme [Planctomycetia bacterium]
MGTNRSSVKAFSPGFAAWACLLAAPAFAATLDMVTVGDPGNAADTSPAGRGAVSTSFKMMTYEFTNQQYASFLNAVAATDTYSLYNSRMGSNARGGITQSGASGTYSYAAKENMGDKPVNYVSWFDAARVANWYQNGATGTSSTETGAYDLNGINAGYTVAVNAGATFFIPTVDQWYKAAFYKSGGTDAGYWNYATQSDTAPTAVSAGATGIGSAGNTGNYANYAAAAVWNGLTGDVTTIGTNGGPGAYGTFDMSGNLNEWNDYDGVTIGGYRGIWGGSWNGDANDLSSSRSVDYAPTQESSTIGFRLASPVSSSAVPEIDPATGGSALSLVAGVLAMIEQRRRRAAIVA